jgi:hypothetical protein
MKLIDNGSASQALRRVGGGAQAPAPFRAQRTMVPRRSVIERWTAEIPAPHSPSRKTADYAKRRVRLRQFIVDCQSLRAALCRSKAAGK